MTFALLVLDETQEHSLYSLHLYSQVCLGAEAEDKFHTVEMEGLTYDGKSTKITLAVLKPSVLPCVSLQVFCFKVNVHKIIYTYILDYLLQMF